MLTRWYTWYCLTIILVLGAAEWWGWSFLDRHEARGIGPTIRNNPGAYRSHYSGGGRYLHGK